MSEAQRYSPGLISDSEGEYVLHSDYQAIRDERDRLRRAIETFHSAVPKYSKKKLHGLSGEYWSPAGMMIDTQLIAELYAALTPAGQRWTRNKPTEPGWYWFRTLLDDVEIVKIGRVDGVLMVYGHGYGTGAKLGHQGPGEWQGPISPNEATE